ncbi:MAG: UbiA family prenyltransferase [Caulobacteraceae bacterium]|nr:UbiA family prenyltransferase [Caulobacteraceae bacterium]
MGEEHSGVHPADRRQGWADLEGWKDAFLAFVALCCAASSVYLFNDAFDIPADRRHPPGKRNRPFASGTLSPARGIAFAIGLSVAALLVGWLAHVVVLTLLYMIISSLYGLDEAAGGGRHLRAGHALRIARVVGRGGVRASGVIVDAGVFAASSS